MQRLNIVVAMISMAAGAWQGTTAQSGTPGSARDRPASKLLILRGCVEKGPAPGSYRLLVPPPVTADATGPDSAASSAAQPEGGAASPASSGPRPAGTVASDSPSRTVTYELVPAGPEVDLAPLVGKRVLAQGTPERTAKGATADDSPSAAAAAADLPTDSSTPAGTAGASTDAGTTPQRSRLRVATIEPVGGTCN